MLVGTNVCSPVFVSCWWELMCVVLCACCICVMFVGTNVCSLVLCRWELMCVVLCASCICVVLVGTNVCSPVYFLYLRRVGGN